MDRPPWIRKAEGMFGKPKTTGNTDQNRERYNSRWRKASSAYFKGHKCDIPHCMRLAYCTDHIYPITMGGSQWDRRNWQRMCRKHHDIKRGREAHGIVCEGVETETGIIPKHRLSLPPDIVGQSYMLK